MDYIEKVIGWIFLAALVLGLVAAVITGAITIVLVGAALPLILLAMGIVSLGIYLLGASMASGVFEVLGIIGTIIGVLLFIFT